MKIIKPILWILGILIVVPVTIIVWFLDFISEDAIEGFSKGSGYDKHVNRHDNFSY